jgi:hypothetical protein
MVFEERKFPDQMKDTNSYIGEVPNFQAVLNKGKSTPKHIIMNLLKTKSKEKGLKSNQRSE